MPSFRPSDDQNQEIRELARLCGIGFCPAIYTAGQRDYIVVGTAVADASRLRELKGKIGPDEQAVTIPRELIAALLKVDT